MITQTARSVLVSIHRAKSNKENTKAKTKACAETKEKGNER